MWKWTLRRSGKKMADVKVTFAVGGTELASIWGFLALYHRHDNEDWKQLTGYRAAHTAVREMFKTHGDEGVAWKLPNYLEHEYDLDDGEINLGLANALRVIRQWWPAVVDDAHAHLCAHVPAKYRSAPVWQPDGSPNAVYR